MGRAMCVHATARALIIGNTRAILPVLNALVGNGFDSRMNRQKEDIGKPRFGRGQIEQSHQPLGSRTNADLRRALTTTTRSPREKWVDPISSAHSGHR
jgi:hypothetical protein